jgi:hypothetical protein
VVGPSRRSDWNGHIVPSLPGSGDAPLRTASYLVRGSVHRTGARIRVTAQLEDAQSGVILWSGRFRPLARRPVRNAGGTRTAHRRRTGR